jgi:DNA (cytosine-5)-methyltransferase 1
MAAVDEYLTVADAADLLGVSPNTVRNWAKAGTLEEYRHPVNNYRLFRTSDLKRLRRQIERPLKNPKQPR